jgi:predicted ferric reductase
VTAPRPGAPAASRRPAPRPAAVPAASPRGWAWTQDQREGLLLAVTLLGALAVTSMWWADTPGRSLHTLADRLTAAGRITGLVGTYGVLVQVILMARLPPLDRFIGSDRLAVWHRQNGAYTITLLVAHAVLIVLGYAAADHVSVAHETSTVIRAYPDMLAATVGLGLLIGVGISSIRLARRHLKYETWYLLHLYTYLAIALSFAHELATGNDFATHPGNRVLWVGLYLVTFGLLVAYRVVAPLRDAVRYQLRVASVVAEGPETVSVYVTGRQLDRLRAEAGQFFRWHFLTRDRWWMAHPFSLSAAPNERFLRLTAKGVGDHSTDLRDLAPGTRVVAEGPYGGFTARRKTRDKTLLIAGGVGVTPLRSLLEELTAQGSDVILLYRASTEGDVIFRSELDQLAARRGVVVRYVLGRRDKKPEPLSRQRLHGHVPDIVDRDVYVCGPAGMLESTVKTLRSLGVHRSQIHTERFEL